MNALRVSLTVAALGAALLPAVSAGQGSGMSAGKYQITTTIVSVDMPGAPPQVAQMMAGRPMSSTICITPEQAAKGQVGAPPQAKDCTAVKASVVGGHLESQMTCTMNGSTVTVTNSGTYTGDGFDINGKMVMTGKTAMTQTTKVSAKRVGAC